MDLSEITGLGAAPGSVPLGTADQYGNAEDMEKQFAVKAVQHLETYWGLLEKVRGSKLRLTKIDDEIYAHFKQEFPDWDAAADITATYESSIMKSKLGKEKWRNFINQYQDKVDDFSFGTIIRRRWDTGYDSQEGTFFGVRMQFYAIEIARNKEGLNDWIYEKENPDEAKDSTVRPKPSGTVSS